MPICTHSVRTGAIDTVRALAVHNRAMPNDTRIDIRLPEAERDLFFEAAKIDGLPLSLWIRRVVKKEAEKIVARATEKKKGGR